MCLFPIILASLCEPKLWGRILWWTVVNFLFIRKSPGICRKWKKLLTGAGKGKLRLPPSFPLSEMKPWQESRSGMASLPGSFLLTFRLLSRGPAASGYLRRGFLGACDTTAQSPAATVPHWSIVWWTQAARKQTWYEVIRLWQAEVHQETERGRHKWAKTTYFP